jgi:hypothetical protein
MIRDVLVANISAGLYCTVHCMFNCCVGSSFINENYMLYSTLLTHTYIFCVYWCTFSIVSACFVCHMVTAREDWYYILMVIETTRCSSDMSGMNHFLKVCEIYTYSVVCSWQRGNT